MFCPNCGSELEEGSVFCGSCGTRLAPEAAATTVAATSKPLCSFKIGNMDFSIVKENIDIMGCIAAVVAFISLFLPYLTCTIETWNGKVTKSTNFFAGTTSNAIFITLAVILFIAANVFGKKLLTQIIGYVNLAFVFITIIGIGSDIAKFKSKLFGISDSLLDELSQWGLGNYSSSLINELSDEIKVYPSVGFYILLLASLVMAFSWLIKSKLLIKLKK